MRSIPKLGRKIQAYRLIVPHVRLAADFACGDAGEQGSGPDAQGSLVPGEPGREKKSFDYFHMSWPHIAVEKTQNGRRGQTPLKKQHVLKIY